ncbi:tigger transposable element-derived 6-like [Brachionus plicatilis]|uniref:Tigger transposable element-derived 6-like n=1 Tax=Brachionus plicatilis TaxID=10195 RepID=A0A3M7RJY5_BRAPC|nr:tigger transposable element-derived 6-like [Brachionus plicatilis]
MELTIEQKREICLFESDNPWSKQNYLCKYFSEKFKQNKPTTTMSDILKNRKNYLNSESINSYRIRNSKYPELEDALFYANEFGIMLNIKDFKYSTGWLDKFKKRNHISNIKLHGESGSVSSELINDGRQKIKNWTKDFGLDDIYNIDETALFFKLEPNKTLSTQQVHGKKVNKERITIAIGTNLTGKHKLEPIVIGKYKRPHCFKNCKPSDILPYYFNSNAWMTAIVFRDILEKFNDQIKILKPNRKVLLLVDNASAHGTEHDLSHVICHYRKLLVESLFESFELFNEAKLPDLKQALLMVKRAWRLVDSDCIKNCSNKCDIVEKKISCDQNKIFDETASLCSLDDLLKRLRSGYYDYVCSPKEFIESDERESTTFFPTNFKYRTLYKNRRLNNCSSMKNSGKKVIKINYLASLFYFATPKINLDELTKQQSINYCDKILNNKT